MDDTVRPPPPRATPGQLRRDQARIQAELTGADGGIDPFPAAVRATRMPMVITDPRRPDNPIVFVNDAFLRLTGYAREEILGRNCRFLQGPETDPDTVRRIREAVAAPRSIEIDIRNHKRDGTPFWNRLLLAPVNDAGGRLAYFFASQLDVTLQRERLAVLEDENAALTAERQVRRAQLALSEESLRLATEAAEIGTWDLDLTTDVLTWSDRTKAMFGISPGGPCSMAEFYAGLHPDDLPATRDAFASALDPARRTTYDVEYRTVGLEDGRLRWVAAKGRGLFDEAGRCVRALGTAIDITARKATEERLRLGETELRELNATLESRVSERTAERDRVWRNSRDLLVVLGADGVVRAVNPAWTAILGHETEEVVGRRFLEFVWPEDAPLTRSGLDDAAAARDLTGFENRYTHRDGTPRWISWHTSVEGDLVFAYGRHVTAEREAAAQLEQAQDALRQAQKMEAVGQLTGGVAHDFNNLLTIIRSSMDFLRRPTLPEERRQRYMDAVADTVERATKLTGQLLAFARRQALKPEVFEVGDRLRNVADMLDTVTGSRIRIVTEVPDAPCFVLADLSQFETALINMAVNARDAMDGEGTLTLRLTCRKGVPPIRGHAGNSVPFAAIALADTGMGIGPDRIGRIFEPFYTTKEVGKGTGLGLSQVFGFAKQSGGDVDVASTPDEGTTFTLYLPEVEAVPEPAGREEADGVSSAGEGRRVLVVEDNIEVGRFATQILQDLGYETAWVANAEEALDRLGGDGGGFDVVFSDVVMPGMGGIALVRELRRRLPRLPVVLASGYSDVLAQEGSQGFELLHKPYAADQLGRTLNRVVLQHAQAAAGGRDRAPADPAS